MVEAYCHRYRRDDKILSRTTRLSYPSMSLKADATTLYSGL